MDFETSKSVNPFLMDDINDFNPVAQNGAASSNPFLTSDFSAQPLGSDNPFLSESYSENVSLPETNPFASFGVDNSEQVYQNQSWQQPAQEFNIPTAENFSLYQQQQSSQIAQTNFVAKKEVRPNELELVTNNTNVSNDFLLSSDEESGKPKRPPPPHPTMPKETQDLILSVTGALEATSHHLLDRLPPTRAPSPTAFPDFQSLSPVPDSFADLLGSPQAEPAPLNLPQFPSNDDFNILTNPEKPPPPRPLPARPAPPKPVPPKLATSTELPKSQPQEDDMFDLFGTSKPPPPKTKDAILNLYSQPKPPPKDLLTDDLDIPGGEAPLFSNEIHPNNQTVDFLPPSSQAEIIPPTEKVQTVLEPQLNKSAEILHSDSTAPIPNNTLAQAPAPIPTLNKDFPIVPPRPPQPPQPAQPHISSPIPNSESVPSVLSDSSISAPAPLPTQESEPAFNNSCIIPSVLPTVQDSEPVTISPRVPPPVPPAPPPASVIKHLKDTPKKVDLDQQEEKFSNAEVQNNVFTEPKSYSQPEIDTNVNSTVEEEPHYIFGTKPPETTSKPVLFNSEQMESGNAEVITTGTVSSEQSTFDFNQHESKVLSNFTNVNVMQSQPSLDAFDAFAAKFESTSSNSGGNFFDPFGGSGKADTNAWGSVQNNESDQQGFGTEDSFDAFLSMSQPPSVPGSNKLHKTESAESEEGGFNVFIKPRQGEVPGNFGAVPVLAPPPKSPGNNIDGDAKFNPFDKGSFSVFSATEGVQLPPLSQTEPYEGGFKRSESQETPPTPLFDEDVSQPLEDFPRIHYVGDGWEMQLRQPNKKKITGQRFWKKIFVKLVYQGDNPVLQLFNLKEDKDPFQELPLQACYSVSEISAQQYDQFGKIFTVKLQYIFYKERPGVRPGQVTKAERITNKLSQFAAYAIQGDYQGVKEFGSDLRKLGLPVEHAPQISQLLKLGCMSYEDLKQFSVTLEECLFRMPVHRDRALNYKMEEVQITVVDEIYVEQNAIGHVEKQIARVRLFFLGFLSGMPDVELGLNDIWRQGKEVVGRHDIIPVVTEEWIRLEAVEFHSCIQQEEYEKTRTIKFKPPDACYIELMRFRIRPPRNRELPLQLKAVMCITGSKVELRADVLVPGFTSRKLGQIPCEDVMIRFPIPECWIYLFRVEKHFRYGSVKSAHRRTGKIKGIERFLGAVDTLEPSLMEVTSGQAKYEHQHRSIVWRMPRLPKEGQGAYTTHNLVCRMQLTSFDQIPDNLAEYAYVEFTMPATQASHTTVRSVSLCDSPSDNPPEKYVRQLARHEYRVGIEHVHTEETAAYEAATMVKPKVPETVPETRAPVESDSDSSD